MSGKPPSYNTLVQLLILLLLSISIPGFVFAKANKEAIPQNARTRTYGNGWDCNLGYKKNGKICDAIKIPENSYLTDSSYGDGWKCKWGYRKTGASCTVIMIPVHAYLNSNGHDWQCDRGFKPYNKTCVVVKIPENGYFTHSTYGAGWECERGYLAVKESCIALLVPENAHINYSEHGWDCNPPYTRYKDQCELPTSNH